MGHIMEFIWCAVIVSSFDLSVYLSHIQHIHIKSYNTCVAHSNAEKQYISIFQLLKSMYKKTHDKHIQKLYNTHTGNLDVTWVSKIEIVVDPLNFLGVPKRTSKGGNLEVI